MESLGRLGDNLPSQAIDKELSAAFRVAATSLTGLFKSGRKAQQQAYCAGKREALQDVLEFIQATLDHSSTTNTQGPTPQASPTTRTTPPPPADITARLIDYLEARQEAIRLEEQSFAESTSQDSTPSSSRATGSSSARFFESREPDQQQHYHHPGKSSTVHHPRASAPPSSSPVIPSSTNTFSRSSSYPASSLHHVHSNRSHHRDSNATPTVVPHSAVTAPNVHNASAPSSTGTIPPSPLTRLQARREKEKERRGTSKAVSSSLGAALAGASTNQGATMIATDGQPSGPANGDLSQLVLVPTIKRRWDTVSMSEVALDDDEGHHDLERESVGEDAMDLELDDRPLKRFRRPGEGLQPL